MSVHDCPWLPPSPSLERREGGLGDGKDNDAVDA